MRSVLCVRCATILIALNVLVIGTLGCFAADALVSWQADCLQIAFYPVVAPEPTQLFSALPAAVVDRATSIHVISIGEQADRFTGTHVLPKDRIHLFWQGKSLTPDQSVPRNTGYGGNAGLLPFEELLPDPSRLVVAVTIKPSDPPGVYECRLKLGVRRLGSRDTGSYEDETITALISVQVQPWVRMSTAESSVTLLPEIDPLTTRLVLSSPPTVVRVASNTQWTLGCQLESLPSRGSEQVSIRIEAGLPSGRLATVPPSSRLTAVTEVCLAAGGQTCVDDRYWCEIPLTVTISNPTTIRSGPLDFELRLSVRTDLSP
jgi:hypothetical protein